MLHLIDKLACWWIDYRQGQNIKHIPPEYAQFDIQSIEANKKAIEIVAIAPSIVIMADEATALLEAENAKNYFQFDMMPRLDRGLRPIRVTVQWAYGESPAAQNARLRDEVARLRERQA